MTTKNINIAINGLGRIGRQVLRALALRPIRGIQLVAVNGTASAEDYRHLVQYDSVHGRFPHEITAEKDRLKIGALDVQVLQERDPSQLPWRALNIDMVLECTGKFNSRELSAQHLNAGARHVVVSAPCKDADRTIVFGVNHSTLQAADQIISVGSCTTNCLAPVAATLHQELGIVRGFMTTIHAYTGDQNILDNRHKDKRRGRACAMSMVPTSTGAAKAIGLVIPELAGKLHGSAIRVPVPNVSMIDFCFEPVRPTSTEEVNSMLIKAAKTSLAGILDVSDEPLVSIDFNHNPHSAIVDLAETHVVDEKLVRVVAWYDNEWGFSQRMLDVTAQLAEVCYG